MRRRRRRRRAAAAATRPGRHGRPAERRAARPDRGDAGPDPAGRPQPAVRGTRRAGRRRRRRRAPVVATPTAEAAAAPWPPTTGLLAPPRPRRPRPRSETLCGRSPPDRSSAGAQRRPDHRGHRARGDAAAAEGMARRQSAAAGRAPGARRDRARRRPRRYPDRVLAIVGLLRHPREAAGERRCWTRPTTPRRFETRLYEGWERAGRLRLRSRAPTRRPSPS